MNTLLIPRLSIEQATRRLTYIEAALSEGQPVSTLVDIDPPEATPNATGGQAATSEHIQQWRTQVRSRVVPIWGTKKESNDRHSLMLGSALNEMLDPLPSDAAHDGVWAYLSLYVFPDIVLERWPTEGIVKNLLQEGKVSLSASRWIGAPMGRDRNYLKVAWRRWRLLGDILPEVDPPIGEDEFGSLFERTAVARNSRLIRESVRVIANHDPSLSSRSWFTREFMKRICYQTGPRLLDVLDDEEILRVVTTARDAALAEQI